jgi:uncharacterized membrane protein
MLQHTALFFHLAAFALYTGAAIAQQRLIAASAADGLAAEVRKAYEEFAEGIVSRVELPSIFLAGFSGILFLVDDAGFLKQAAWFHPKMLCVLLLAVLSHLEMFNTRRIVRARFAGKPEAEILARKKRHAVYGWVGAFLLVVVLVLVAFVRTA